MLKKLLVITSLLAISYSLQPNSVNASTNSFSLGMFEDNHMMTNQTGFEDMINNLRSHNLDSVLFTNSSNVFHLPILDVSDRLGFNVIWGGPMNELLPSWFDNPITSTTQNAETIIGPLVDQVKNHSSVKGYSLLDDTVLADADKLKKALTVFKAHDTQRPATAVFTIGNEKAYLNSGAGSFLTYYYPAKAPKNACDWNFISPTQNGFSYALRELSRYKPQNIPLWTVLQTHGSYPTTTATAPAASLRVPTPEEVSLQHWIALGEGSKGLFWFIYSTQQYWTGLKDSPVLFNQIKTVSGRTKPLIPILTNLEKTVDYFGLNGTGNRYVSTMMDTKTGKYYVVIANALCGSSQQLTLTSNTFSGNLKDIETNQIIAINSPITLNSGDGKIYEVVNSSIAIPSPSQAPNLIHNPSFETWTNSVLATWSGAKTGSSQETSNTHTGSNSLKLTGPSSSYTWQKSASLKPGSLYTLKYWIKTPVTLTGTGVGFRLGMTSGVKNINQNPETTSDWKQVTDYFYIPLDFNASRDRIDLIWDLKAGETAYIDDVSICEGQDCLPKTATLQTQTPSKPGYTNADNNIDIFDHNTLLGNFGKSGSTTEGDTNNSGTIDIFDYNTLLGNFGK